MLGWTRVVKNELADTGYEWRPITCSKPVFANFHEIKLKIYTIRSIIFSAINIFVFPIRLL